MTAQHITREGLEALVREQQGRSTFIPSATEHLAWLEAAGQSACLEPLAQPRAAQSPKGFFLPPAESVGRYGEKTPALTAVQAPGVAVLGVRACELRARAYLDKVMLEGAFEAPDYQARRQSTVVVACDCVDCAPSCFCTLVGGRPYATEGYDVNLSPVPDGYVVEVATDRGRQWLAQGGAAGLPQATAQQTAQRDEARRQMTQRLGKQNERFTFAADDRAAPKLPNDNDESWQTFAADCVECAACTHICPTCHCFYLYDQVLGPEAFERVRTWDSCLLSSYHRMAGGVRMKLSPRARLLSRLANRVLHKFAYSPQQYGLLGCVGCGRCVDACLGAIDIRQVVQELGQ